MIFCRSLVCFSVGLICYIIREIFRVRILYLAQTELNIGKTPTVYKGRKGCHKLLSIYIPIRTFFAKTHQLMPNYPPFKKDSRFPRPLLSLDPIFSPLATERKQMLPLPSLLLAFALLFDLGSRKYFSRLCRESTGGPSFTFFRGKTDVAVKKVHF